MNRANSPLHSNCEIEQNLNVYQCMVGSQHSDAIIIEIDFNKSPVSLIKKRLI